MNTYTHYCNTLQHTATQCSTLLRHTASQSCISILNWCTWLIRRMPPATHCNALHWNTLQHTATHCNTLQDTATHCNTLLQHTASRWDTETYCNIRYMRLTRSHSTHSSATHCHTLQHAATYCNACNIMQHTATCCTTPLHTAPHFTTLLHTAAHCNNRYTRLIKRMPFYWTTL